MTTRIPATLLLVVMTVAAAPGQTPLGTAFSYQGRLENAGSPAGGVHDLRFRLYDALSGGAQVGATVCFDDMNVTDGLFTVSLDFGAQFTGQERFLEVEVRADNPRDCTNSSGFITLTPRQPLTATPYSLQTRGLFVDNAGRVAIGTTTPVNQLTIDGGLTLHDVNDDDVVFYTGNFYINNGGNEELGYHYQSNPEQHEFFVDGGLTMRIAPDGNVGIGINAETPGARLHARSASTTGIGVYGQATGGSAVNFGVSGQSASTQGRGVTGVASAISGTTYGGYFESASMTGRGVYGDATAADGFTYGGRFHSASVNGRGVYGDATATSGETYGGRFHSASTDGRGVYGVASAATGETYGVYGESASTFGYGVYGTGDSGVWGQTDSIGGHGVRGVSSSGSGRGVSGWATSGGFSYGGYFQSDGSSGRGVYGLATFASPGATPYGVLGECSTAATGYAVYALGDMGASGVKPFRIDHPDDPANKYLLHYAAESPEVINFYSETVTLDERGEAVVELPHYFAKINTRPRYQLTAVGAPMPMLHVAGEIDEVALIAGAKAEPGEPAPACSFRIAGGVPGAKVSWEVKAVRNDRWVQKGGAPVEIDKQRLEKGTYQHPELYGQPPEKGMNYDAERERSSQPSTAGEHAPVVRERESE